MLGLGNNPREIGKFQCGFENDKEGGGMDLVKILLLFLIFEIECIFLVV
jgi:NADH:ubiquinone oxidoreductase subunit 3 (subunit A)